MTVSNISNSNIMHAKYPSTAHEGLNSLLSSDFETFLKMLTVQMKNQDPLNPIESSDYAVQLATFSGVEQQVQANETLKMINDSLGTGSLAELSNWLGKEVPFASPAHYTGKPLTLLLDSSDGTTSRMIEVHNSNGVMVQRFEAPLDSSELVWSGHKFDGRTLPQDTYTFNILDYNQNRLTKERLAPIYQRVIEVFTNERGGELALSGGNRVAAKDIKVLREPTKILSTR